LRLEELTPSHVRRAVRTYMQLAWPDPANCKPRFDPAQLEDLTSLDEIFALCERPEVGGGGHSARYMLRLGNDQYPFMKMVIQEYLVDREYFFSVDTHDEHIMSPDHPEWAEWCELKNHNRELKTKVEAEWVKESLPTHADLRTLAEGLARLEREEDKRTRLLVVDDEKDVCQGLGALLEARGYAVELAYDGQQVIDRLQLDPLPDLVILDFAMPELDGSEVLRMIRDDERLAKLNVLLATASSIDLKNMQRANGLLRKPYPRDVLIAMIKQLLAQNVAPSPPST